MTSGSKCYQFRPEEIKKAIGIEVECVKRRKKTDLTGVRGAGTITEGEERELRVKSGVENDHF